MSDLMIYNNQLWKLKYSFKNTANIHPFTLPAGTYLLSCQGAYGGAGKYYGKQPGGSAYGILDLNETSTLYAVAGGDGKDAVGSVSNYGFDLTTDMCDVILTEDVFDISKWANKTYTTYSSNEFVTYSQSASMNVSNGYAVSVKSRFASIDAKLKDGTRLSGYFQLLTQANPSYRYGASSQYKPYTSPDTVLILDQDPVYVIPTVEHFISSDTRTDISLGDIDYVRITWYNIKPEYQYKLRGYNGGGQGGRKWFGDSYYNGAGGGGASDIRTYPNIGPQEIHKTLTIPSEFDELEYIEYDLSAHAAWIDTEYIHKSTTKFECDTNTPNSVYAAFSTIFGARRNSYDYNAFVLFTSYLSNARGCYSRTGIETQFAYPYNQDIHIEASGLTINIYDIDKTQLLVSQTVSGRNDDGVCSMVLGNLNISSDVKTSIYYPSSDTQYVGKIYKFIISEQDIVKHYFVPVQRKNDSYTITLHSDDFESGTITDSGDIVNTTRIRTKNFYSSGNFKGTVTFEGYDKNGTPLNLSITEYYTANKNSTYIANLGNWCLMGSSTGYTSVNTNQIRFILKIDDNTNFDPSDLDYVTITVSNCNAGLFDMIDQKFYANHVLTTDFGRGAIVPDAERTTYDLTTYIDYGLYSRILVAGGGGGGNNITNYGYTFGYSGFGGGAYGGTVSEEPYNVYASQTNGYSFGIGMTPPPKTYSYTYGSDGAGGGGGGWYGGYSSTNVTTTYTSTNGGGGSGYAFTEQSYLPDPTLAPDSKYHLRNVLLDAAMSEESCVKVYELTTDMNAGDVITIPRTGTHQHYRFNPGSYMLKCYGGDGGKVVTTFNNRGGYTEGILSPEEPVNLFFVVGGSSIFGDVILADRSTVVPLVGYNGGGEGQWQNGNYCRSAATYGAGATDIRVNTDDLYARIMVAGGAGGSGSDSSYGYGGSGGGETGGASKYITDLASPGPGTQTGSPQSSSADYAFVNGGFGYGGNGDSTSGSNLGGAGGGGWYGGSGTSRVSYTSGGNGGSGYVLTEDSYKPSGYLIDDPGMYITDGETTTGGNDLNLGITKIVINVIDSSSPILLLCHDEEGYKTYDSDNNIWTLIDVSSLTPEVFESYGVYKFNSDNGLLSDYTVYAYTDDGNITSMNMNVSPPTQTLTAKLETSKVYNTGTIDGDYNSDEIVGVEFEYDYAKLENQINVIVDKPDIDTIVKLYYVNMYYSSNKVHSNRYIAPKEPIEPSFKSLLKVLGASNEPISKTFITTYLDPLEGSAITSISSFTSYAYDRKIFMALTLNDTHIRILSWNIADGRRETILEVPKSTLGGSCGGMIVDDNGIYFTPSYMPYASYQSNNRNLYYIPFDDVTDISIYTTTKNISGNGLIDNGIGKSEIIIPTWDGYAIFDTKYKRFKYIDGHTSSRTDIAVGSHSYGFGDANRYYSIYDINTETWSVPVNTGAGYYTYGCYHDGKYYVASGNSIFVIDEDTKEIEETLLTSASDIHGVYYVNGNLFMIDQAQSETRLFTYNLTSKTYSWVYLPWVLPKNAYNYNDRQCRGCVCNNTLYIPDLSLGIINKHDDVKYRFGGVYSMDVLSLNSITERLFTYDERFVTFMSTHVRIHDGTITKPAIGTGDIKSFDVSKSEYSLLKSIKIETETEGD